MARKTYILDTSVLIHAPNSISVFYDNDVIIPIAVLEELDHLKSRSDTVGSNSRIAIRIIDNYCKDKDISGGIEIENNIKLFIDVIHIKDSRFVSCGKDDSILACALAYNNSILVTKDINLRVRANAYGVKAEDYSNDKLNNISDLYTGYRDVELNDDNVCESFTDNGVDNVVGTIFESLYPNECVQVSFNGKKSLFRRKGNVLKPIRIPNEIWSIKSRNREQAYALELLLDPTVPLVTMIGKAGCGKTLLTMAAALDQCINNKKYSKMEIYRPIQPVGNDLGFLPGSLEEKLAPWMGSIYDAFEFLMGSNYQQMMTQYQDRIKLEAITYIRGKSVNKTFMALDEAQNLTRNEVKTILTRVGFDTKIVVLGDIEQIDSHYLDATNNGLTYVVESFKTSELSGHVTLVKGERSQLATEASKIL